MLSFRHRKEQGTMATIDSSYVAFDIMLANGKPVSDTVLLDQMLVFEFTGKVVFFEGGGGGWSVWNEGELLETKL